MIKLSFIVPVYNVALYLRKCVDSLLAQDFYNYEIILVDDGSPDECPAICDEYASSHDNIRVIHQANGGLSAARNSGLKVAQGEYVCFVDSDDYWQPSVLSGLMAQVEQEHLDVLRFDFQNVDDKYDVYVPDKFPHQIDSQTMIVSGEVYLNERMGYGCYAWQFIVRREVAPSFVKGIYFEDTEWTPRMLVAAKSVNATPTVVYNYLTRLGSITQKYDKEHVRKKNDGLMQVNLSLLRLLQIVSDGRWINGCIADNVYCMLNNVAAYDYESASSLVKEIKKSKMLPLHGYKVRMVIRLRYMIINISPMLYCWLRNVRTTCLRK